MRRAVRTALAALATAAALAVPAGADEALPPPHDWGRAAGGVEVLASVSEDVTRVRAPDGTAWAIPRWVRHLEVAPDGRTALVLPDGHPLVPDRDPGQVVLEVHGPTGLVRAVRLGEVADPEALPATASHVLLLEGVGWDPARGGWTLWLADGGAQRVDAATGGVRPVQRGRATAG